MSGSLVTDGVMARAKVKNLPDLSPLAQPGQDIAVKVSPNAARTQLVAKGDGLHASVTAPPDNGKANDAVTQLVAQALGVAPSRVWLLRGHTSRHKIFRVS